jgi:hypothetical protein
MNRMGSPPRGGRTHLGLMTMSEEYVDKLQMLENKFARHVGKLETKKRTDLHQNGAK